MKYKVTYPFPVRLSNIFHHCKLWFVGNFLSSCPFLTTADQTLTDILIEGQRLVHRVAHPESSDPVFLDAT